MKDRQEFENAWRKAVGDDNKCILSPYKPCYWNSSWHTTKEDEKYSDYNDVIVVIDNGVYV